MCMHFCVILCPLIVCLYMFHYYYTYLIFLRKYLGLLRCTSFLLKEDQPTPSSPSSTRQLALLSAASLSRRQMCRQLRLRLPVSGSQNELVSSWSIDMMIQSVMMACQSYFAHLLCYCEERERGGEQILVVGPLLLSLSCSYSLIYAFFFGFNFV